MDGGQYVGLDLGRPDRLAALTDVIAGLIPRVRELTQWPEAMLLTYAADLGAPVQHLVDGEGHARLDVTEPTRQTALIEVAWLEAHAQVNLGADQYGRYLARRLDWQEAGLAEWSPEQIAELAAEAFPEPVRSPLGEDAPFQTWLVNVNTLLRKEIGLDLDELPDLPTRDAFDDGTQPLEFVREQVADMLDEEGNPGQAEQLRNL